MCLPAEDEEESWGRGDSEGSKDRQMGRALASKDFCGRTILRGMRMQWEAWVEEQRPIRGHSGGDMLRDCQSGKLRGDARLYIQPRWELTGHLELYTFAEPPHTSLMVYLFSFFLQQNINNLRWKHVILKHIWLKEKDASEDYKRSFFNETLIKLCFNLDHNEKNKGLFILPQVESVTISHE